MFIAQVIDRTGVKHTYWNNDSQQQRDDDVQGIGIHDIR